MTVKRLFSAKNVWVTNVHADLRDPDTILREAARILDFTRPIALMLLGIVEHIMDTDEAYAIVHQLLAALPSGSYLVLCDPTTEVHREVMLEAIRQWNDSATLLITARSRQELIRFFDGMELLEPGGDCCIEGRRRSACSSACAAAAVFVRSSRRDRRSLASGSRGR